VAGGKGAVTEVFGGGGGFALGRNAPAVASDFLKFISSADRQRARAADGDMIPTVLGAEDALTDTNLRVVARTLTAATGFQLYLDQAYPPAIGQQVNDSVADLVAGKATPTQVVKAITEAARR
jgi:raffinose/stachyose/melibiose transport system substrate-binding protein